MVNTGYNAILDRFPIIDSMGTDALTAARQQALNRANAAAQASISAPDYSSSVGSPGYNGYTGGHPTTGSYSGGPGQSFYQALINGGFSPQAARIMYGIAGAESSYNGNARGDLGLMNNTWGPSYGYFQIRTLKGAPLGDDRNLQTLMQGGLARQIAAAYRISNGGRNFGPWSTYNHGSYRSFLPSFDVGAWELPQDTVAQLHQGEMVVPSDAAEILRKVVGSPRALGIRSGDPMQGQPPVPQGPLSPYVLNILQHQGVR